MRSLIKLLTEAEPKTEPQSNPLVAKRKERIDKKEDRISKVFDGIFDLVRNDAYANVRFLGTMTGRLKTKGALKVQDFEDILKHMKEKA